MKAHKDGIAELFLANARELFQQNLSRVDRSLRLLDEEEIWWRPNRASNSAGNLVLHLCGNIRQWIVSGMGGAPDLRVRDREFSERGPIPRRTLIAQLRSTVADACVVLDGLSPEDLAHKYSIQGYRVTGLAAASHVYEHFSYHTGQIIYVTKLKKGKDLRFTRLPVVKKQK